MGTKRWSSWGFFLGSPISTRMGTLPSTSARHAKAATRTSASARPPVILTLSLMMLAGTSGSLSSTRDACATLSTLSPIKEYDSATSVLTVSARAAENVICNCLHVYIYNWYMGTSSPVKEYALCVFFDCAVLVGQELQRNGGCGLHLLKNMHCVCSLTVLSWWGKNCRELVGVDFTCSRICIVCVLWLCCLDGARTAGNVINNWWVWTSPVLRVCFVCFLWLLCWWG